MKDRGKNVAGMVSQARNLGIWPQLGRQRINIFSTLP